MRNMKRFAALALVMAMMLSLAACGTRNPAEETVQTTPAATVPGAETGAYTPKNGTNLKLVLLVPGLLGDKSF